MKDVLSMNALTGGNGHRFFWLARSDPESCLLPVENVSLRDEPYGFL